MRGRKTGSMLLTAWALQCQEPLAPLRKGSKKPSSNFGILTRAWALISLTMSYFHTGIRTIIGAESFHCPVRDGKEWDQLAMVIRLNW